MKLLLLALMAAGCAGCGDDATQPAPAPVDVAAPCDAPPMGFLVWERDGLVQVSKNLHGVRQPGGVVATALIISFFPSELPAVADFGPERIEVREGLTLCLLPPASAE